VRHALELHVPVTGAYREGAHVGKPLDGIDLHLVDRVDRHVLRREPEQAAPAVDPGAREERVPLGSDREEPGQADEHDAAGHEGGRAHGSADEDDRQGDAAGQPGMPGVERAPVVPGARA
jgi:hypothetical protein